MKRGVSTHDDVVLAKDNGVTLAADPAAGVPPGTTVVRRWPGQDTRHNVVAGDADPESDPVPAERLISEHTAEEPGTYRYACTPHRPLWTRGVR
ncbi:hypothetical protein [Haloplanus sp.]|uniref:hypothetical protein n=1 Tax=Haloplanus sp. TaxID=1961696 RepID=UPI0026062A91|nr:hypothetical protein [Haloplanus sp.]